MKTDPREIRLIEKAAVEFARKELAPDRRAHDKYPFGSFFGPIVEKAFELDFFHAALPEDLGGMGRGIRAFCVLLEKLCMEDASLGGVLFANACSQEILTAAGEGDRLKEMAGASRAADFLIAFPCFNHPSQIPHIARAGREKDRYALSGTLEYLVLGSVARWAVIPAVMDGREGFSYFLADLNDPGVEKSEVVLSMGLRSCPAVDAAFDGVPAILAGEPGWGTRHFEAAAPKMILAAAAMSLGVMGGSFREALAYGKKRSQGGRKIVDWTQLQMILADMAIGLEMGKRALESVLRSAEDGEKGWEDSALAVSAAIQRQACDAVSDGVQALGGAGYMSDYGQEKRFRDAMQLQSLLGLAPLKRINFLRRLAGRDDLFYKSRSDGQNESDEKGKK
ncbi:Acyl-CoA dehydrogenase [Candidatus Desulfarcum epimagneticum]|uniref:Acyl-CoA dehydrogenase n=1 Tax=uncultured Desulfobacteraceae bacterium TaxID=218296 RepID=A0A484HIA3_9BACT|nr:Acyl-CoA dehydrogenase [uncultured Desulfobacteraceae bacterium]